MTASISQCLDHTGHEARIKVLEGCQAEIFTELKNMRSLQTKIFTGVILLLGSVVVDISIRVYTNLPHK